MLRVGQAFGFKAQGFRYKIQRLRLGAALMYRVCGLGLSGLGAALDDRSPIEQVLNLSSLGA